MTLAQQYNNTGSTSRVRWVIPSILFVAVIGRRAWESPGHLWRNTLSAICRYYDRTQLFSDTGNSLEIIHLRLNWYHLSVSTSRVYLAHGTSVVRLYTAMKREKAVAVDCQSKQLPLLAFALQIILLYHYKWWLRATWHRRRGIQCSEKTPIKIKYNCNIN